MEMTLLKTAVKENDLENLVDSEISPQVDGQS